LEAVDEELDDGLLHSDEPRDNAEVRLVADVGVSGVSGLFLAIVLGGELVLDDSREVVLDIDDLEDGSKASDDTDLLGSKVLGNILGGETS